MGVEQELCEATGFNPRKPFKERQDYLVALLKSVDSLKDSEFEALTDEATSWVNEAAKAYKTRMDVPDFEDGEEAETNSEAEEAAEDDADGGEEAEQELAEEIETEEDPEPVKPKKGAKAGKAKPEKPAKAAKPEKAAPKEKAPKEKTDNSHMLDKFGILKESKSHEALKMFEKGSTTALVKEAIGGTYYNVLRRLAAEGHHLEKDGPHVKLTHKDEFGAKAKGKKK